MSSPPAPAPVWRRALDAAEEILAPVCRDRSGQTWRASAGRHNAAMRRIHDLSHPLLLTVATWPMRALNGLRPAPGTHVVVWDDAPGVVWEIAAPIVHLVGADGRDTVGRRTLAQLDTLGERELEALAAVYRVAGEGAVHSALAELAGGSTPSSARRVPHPMRPTSRL